MALITASETAILKRWHAMRQEEDGTTWVQFGSLPRMAHMVLSGHAATTKGGVLSNHSHELSYSNHGRFSVWKVGGVFQGGTYIPVSFHLTDERKHVLVEVIGGGRALWRGRLRFLRNLCDALASDSKQQEQASPSVLKNKAIDKILAGADQQEPAGVLAGPVTIEISLDRDPIVLGQLAKAFGQAEWVHSIEVDFIDSNMILNICLSPELAPTPRKQRG